MPAARKPKQRVGTRTASAPAKKTSSKSATAGARPPRQGAPDRMAETSELRILYQMAGAMRRSLQLDELLRDTLESLETLLAIPCSALYLLKENDGRPRYLLAAQRGFDADFEVERLEFGPDLDWLSGSVSQGRPHVAREPLATPASSVSARGKRMGIQSWVALPLASHGRTVGLWIAASRDLDKFASAEVDLLVKLGSDLAVALENALLFELVQRGRNEWRATFDAVADRMAVLDRDLRVIRANRALLDALGSAPATVIGRTCRELFPELCAHDCPHREALEGRASARDLNTQGRWFRVAVYPGDEGQVLHLAEDVTEERLRAEQLVRAEKLSAASTVLAGVAHELNNPLTVVIAYSDLLSQLDQTQAFHEEVQQILRSALRCQSIVRSLLAFSRSDEPERTEVDVNQLVQETMPLFAYQLRIAGIRVEERLNPTLPAIAGDRARLQQILVNVINNAYQAMSAARRGGWLKIQTRAREGNVEIEVQDDGPGIPGDVLPHVFEPFYTTKAPGQGTGLGLALSQQIARDHGGDIELASDGRNGTRAVVSLPIVAASRAREEAPPPDRASLNGRRILVVDDEPDLRRLVGNALEAYGAEVVLAGGGIEALAILEHDQSFDLVFSDLRMPDLGGDEVVAQLRERRSPLADRVLLTTGDVAAPLADSAVRASGRPCLSKPFTVKDLVATIRDIVA